LVLVIGLAAWGINNCVDRSDRARRAEEQRRAALTPEQRAEEDRRSEAARNTENAEAELTNRKAHAETFSEKCVKRFLKHPDDASFGLWSVPDIRWNAQRTAFYVSSTVKAKNDFGGQLTYRWQTIVLLDGEIWKLVSCAIDGSTMYHDEALTERLAGQAAAGTAPAR